MHERTALVELRDRLRDALAGGDPEAIATAASQLSPVELADLLPELPPSEVRLLLRVLGDERVAELLAELDPQAAARLLLRLSRAEAADILEEMDPDDAADVVEELDPDEAESILIEMETAEAEDIRDLLAYPPESAGGLMTPEFVAVTPSMTADETLQYLRSVAEEAETIYYLYVVDEQDRLIGVVSLRDLVISPGRTPTAEIMHRGVVSVPAEADQEVAARLLAEHDFLALPVVDRERRLLGIITSDDVTDVLEEEATEDITRLGGSQPLEEPYLTASVWHLFRKRIPWLMVLFVAASYTASVIAFFEEVLDQVVALGLFIPLLIGTGGNVGSQTTTTLVRAMGVGEVHFKDLLRVVGRELVVASLLGTAMGAATYLRAWTLGVSVGVAEVVAMTAFFVVLWAGFVAAILPLTLRRLGVDPAVVSAPFITTLVDGTGLFIYFTIARWMLGI